MVSCKLTITVQTNHSSIKKPAPAERVLQNVSLVEQFLINIPEQFSCKHVYRALRFDIGAVCCFFGIGIEKPNR
jgi:hypothetical protein